MNSFLAACAVAIIVAVGGWLVLDRIQQPVSVAYTTTGARI
jgi:Kef-type K+ transport system membrane component KefB